MKNESTKSYYQQGVLRVLQSKAETKAFYNKIAKVYDLLSEHTEGPVREKGLKMLNARADEHILEIGFGTGHSLVKLAEAVGLHGKVFGIDLAEEMIDQSKKHLREKQLDDRVELRCGDAVELPYASGTIDGIFMGFTLELFDTPEISIVLKECRRVLQPQGRIVVVGMSRIRPDSVITEIFEWTHRHFPNLLDCRPILVRQALEDGGFRITDAVVEKMWVNVEIVLCMK